MLVYCSTISCSPAWSSAFPIWSNWQSETLHLLTSPRFRRSISCSSWRSLIALWPSWKRQSSISSLTWNCRGYPNSPLSPLMTLRSLLPSAYVLLNLTSANIPLLKSLSFRNKQFLTSMNLQLNELNTLELLYPRIPTFEGQVLPQLSNLTISTHQHNCRFWQHHHSDSWQLPQSCTSQS